MNFSVAGYVYPGAGPDLRYNFWETKFKVIKTFSYATFSGGVHYSPNYFTDSGEGFYFPAAVNIPIKSGFSLIADGAHQIVSNNKNFRIPDYWHWSGGIGYDFKKFNFSLKYIDTSLSKQKCPDGCEPRVVATIMRFF